MSETFGNPIIDAPGAQTVTTRVGIYWTACPEFWSRGIRYFNRPLAWKVWQAARVSHVGLVFERVASYQGQVAQFRVLHEALFGEGWQRKPWSKLMGFADRDLRNRVVMDWLPIDSATAARIHTRSEAWVGRRSYARWQLLGFAIATSLLGRALGLSLKNDQKRIVCSEGAAYHLAMWAPAWDLRDSPNDSFDSVSPESALRNYLQKVGKTFGHLQAQFNAERMWKGAA